MTANKTPAMADLDKLKRYEESEGGSLGGSANGDWVCLDDVRELLAAPAVEQSAEKVTPWEDRTSLYETDVFSKIERMEAEIGDWRSLAAPVSAEPAVQVASAELDARIAKLIDAHFAAPMTPPDGAMPEQIARSQTLESELMMNDRHYRDKFAAQPAEVAPDGAMPELLEFAEKRLGLDLHGQTFADLVGLFQQHSAAQAAEG